MLQKWSYKNRGGIPKPGGENARINLWLYNGQAPKDVVEVVVSKFEYLP